jgi:HSP20 family molecular chaperone IbpA
MKTEGVNQNSARELSRHKSEQKRISEIQKSELENVKASHQTQLEEARQSHNIQIQDEIAKKEKILADMRESLEKTKTITQKQINDSQELALKRQQEIQQRQSLNVAQTTQSYDEVLKDKNERYNQAIKDLGESAEISKNELELNKNRDFRQARDSWTNKIDQQKTEFNENYISQQNRFETLKNKQSTTHKNELVQTNLKGQKSVAEMNQAQIKQFQKVSDHHSKTLREQEKFNELKFQENLKLHQGTLNNLDKDFQTEVSKIKDEISTRKAMTQQTVGDSFFAFTELKPQVSENEKSYLIKVKIPEYAKEELRLTSNNKTVSLTFGRRHTDSRQTEHSQSKVNRVETIVEKFNLPGDFNPRKIQSKYENGHMIFELPKIIKQSILS